jgi:hypothetical protein
MVEPMAGCLASVAVFCIALGAVATAADAAPCDALSGRLHGQSSRALRTMWHELGIRSGLFENDSAVLHVTSQELSRPDSAQTFVVLDITDSAGEDWQILIFSRTGGRCRVLGAVDAATQGGEPPTRRLVTLAARRAALAVRSVVRTGTGLALYRESWYLLEDRMGSRDKTPDAMALPRVLDYPARGHMVGWPSTFDRSFSTRLQTSTAAGGTDEVRIEFVASYTSGSYIYWMPVEPLFTAIRTAVYTWKGDARRFILDPVRSDVDDDEIEGIFHDAEEQFLVHNVRDLAPLAGRANDRQRTWLRHFLETVADGPEKRAVMENFR